MRRSRPSASTISLSLRPAERWGDSNDCFTSCWAMVDPPCTVVHAGDQREGVDAGADSLVGGGGNEEGTQRQGGQEAAGPPAQAPGGRPVIDRRPHDGAGDPPGDTPADAGGDGALVGKPAAG